MNHRRIGKIARLPAEIREQVNEYIHEGWEYNRIIDWLTQAGHGGVIPSNLTKWKQGGYEDWVKHCQRLEELELKLEYAGELAMQTDPQKFQQATLNLTSLQFFELLNRFNTGDLIVALQAKPEKYPALINSIARFTREAVGLERFRCEQQDKARQEAERKSPNLGGLTPETVRKILEALRLRYPKEFETALTAQTPDQPQPAIEPN